MSIVRTMLSLKTLAGGSVLVTMALGAAPGASDRGAPAGCALQQNCDCAVPGITIRWKAAYCMSREQTDDLEQAGVRRCLDAPDPGDVKKLTARRQNAYWKDRLCRSLHTRAEDARRCSRDRSFVPAFVRTGEGG